MSTREEDGPVTRPDVSILIVSYQCGRYLAACLRSVFTQLRNLSFEVIVIDNASTDDGLSRARMEQLPVKFVPLKQNIGFARGNNLGVEQTKGRYLLLLNPDTELLADSVTPLMRYLDEHPEVGLIGPHHEDRYGQWQRNFGPRILLRDEFAYALRRPGRNNQFMGTPPSEPVSVGWLAGSFLLMPRPVTGEGIFDPRFFLNDEDIDLAVRVRQRGKDVIYHPVRGLRHFGGVSKASRPAGSRDHFISRYRYYMKHHGRMHAAGFVLSHLLIRLRHKASNALSPAWKRNKNDSTE